MYIYIYIYIYTHTHKIIYIYIHTEIYYIYICTITTNLILWSLTLGVFFAIQVECLVFDKQEEVLIVGCGGGSMHLAEHGYVGAWRMKTSTMVISEYE